KGLTDIDKAVILHYRELYGYFSSIDDLALLPGLSSKMDIIRKNFYVELNASMPVKSLTQLRSEANKSTVNINTAEITELIEKLKLNKLEAEMIIKYRERYGTFKKIENLKEVPLVGDKYEILKNKIRVE
ncbi:MAG TPA: helix-hairpin-helix domain-containing protein, partial [bacterium]|nr:helix-hairpin-helix domain-containing protein [bacterium]